MKYHQTSIFLMVLFIVACDETKTAEPIFTDDFRQENSSGEDSDRVGMHRSVQPQSGTGKGDESRANGSDASSPEHAGQSQSPAEVGPQPAVNVADADAQHGASLERVEPQVQEETSLASRAMRLAAQGLVHLKTATYDVGGGVMHGLGWIYSKLPSSQALTSVWSIYAGPVESEAVRPLAEESFRDRTGRSHRVELQFRWENDDILPRSVVVEVSTDRHGDTSPIVNVILRREEVTDERPLQSQLDLSEDPLQPASVRWVDWMGAGLRSLFSNVGSTMSQAFGVSRNPQERIEDEAFVDANDDFVMYEEMNRFFESLTPEILEVSTGLTAQETASVGVLQVFRAWLPAILNGGGVTTVSENLATAMSMLYAKISIWEISRALLRCEHPELYPKIYSFYRPLYDGQNLGRLNPLPELMEALTTWMDELLGQGDQGVMDFFRQLQQLLAESREEPTASDEGREEQI